MRVVRATVAIAAAVLAAIAVVQLARVDAGLGPTFGPERVQRALDAVASPPDTQIVAARSVLEARPVDGRAYRTIALAQGEGALLDTANARWPRDPLTRASLLDRAFAEGDVDTGMAHFDALLRVAPGTASTLLPLLMPHLQDERVRAALVERAAGGPPWRGALLSALRDDNTPAMDADAFLAALARRVPPDDATRDTRIAVLDRAGRHSDARRLWIASLPETDRAEAGLVFDGGFEHPAVQGGYGWRFDDIPGVLIEHDTSTPRTGHSALVVEFQDRAVQFAGVRQTLALAPGNYRLEAAARDDVSGDRPFEWRIACGREVIARLPLARGDRWQVQLITFAVPSNCTGQTLTLVHTARSLEERRLHGRLQIDDVGIFLAE